MNPGNLNLSEIAKHVVAPAGITATGWPAVAATCTDKLGIDFDEWQHGAGRLALSKRADGKLAATVGGVGMSCPRQVGKTYFWTGLAFGLSVNMPGLLTIWTAHHAKTHTETFLAMQGFAKRRRVAPFIRAVYTGSGSEEVRFRNGSRILFGARERGFGRGIPGVDALICDEGQILSEKALQNMLATLNTSGLGLHAYLGTPPKPGDNCETFLRMRAEALGGESTELVWIECGAADDADIDDRAQWTRANPSYPHRTPLEAFLRLRAKLDTDGFRREALGLYDAPSRDVFDVCQWAGLSDVNAAPPTRVALVIAVSPDRSWSSIGVAGDLEDGRTLVLCNRLTGTDGAAAAVADVIAQHDVAEVCLGGAAAKAIAPDLNRAGIEYRVLSGSDMGATCAAFQQSVIAGTVTHISQPELDAAVANARTRMVGEAEQWDRRDLKIDDTPLVACAAALYRWGLQLAPAPAIY